MNHWTIRQRTIGSFALILLLMLLMGGIALRGLQRVDEARRHLETDALPGAYYGGQLLGRSLNNQLLVRMHVIETDPTVMAQLQARIDAGDVELQKLNQLYESSITTDQDRQNFNAFQEAQAGYRRAEKEALRHSTAVKSLEDARAALHNLDEAFEPMEAALEVIVDFNKAGADRSTAEITAAIAAAKTQLLASFALALLIAGVCAWLLLQAINRPLKQLLGVVEVMRTGDFSKRLQLERRDEFGLLADGFNRMVDELTALVGQVQKSGIQVNTSVTEIAATAREQQATASEIAATTTEIGATSKEISATSRELVKTMHEVATVTEESATLAGRGQTGLTQMEETMHNVMEAAGTINAKLAILNEKAGNINQVVTTITKVADQTNLLSLNAAIEAEKAGEYGRGFSVVATEIRRLADQTAVATYDIEQMVKEIQSAVSAGVMGMDKFSEEVRRGMHEVQQVSGQLSQVIQQVQALAPRMESVNEGMQAQATGAEQITQALTQLTEAAQQTVQSLRQSNIAMEGLNQVSTGLRSGVSRFKLEA